MNQRRLRRKMRYTIKRRNRKGVNTNGIKAPEVQTLLYGDSGKVCRPDYPWYDKSGGAEDVGKPTESSSDGVVYNSKKTNNILKDILLEIKLYKLTSHPKNLRLKTAYIPAIFEKRGIYPSLTHGNSSIDRMPAK